VEDLLQHEWINGQVLSGQALFREMSQRRVEVEREKEREREKVREEKMRQVRLDGCVDGGLSSKLAC
jgi:hypothetical protein